MENIARAAGSGATIELMGESLILPALTLKQLGVIENELRLQRGDPLGKALPLMNDEHVPLVLRERLLAKAHDDAWKTDRIDIMELIGYILSPDGLPLAVWVALEKQYPARFTRQQIVDAVADLDFVQLQRLVRAMEVASGMDAAGNSQGPASESKAEEGTPGQSPAPESSES